MLRISNQNITKTIGNTKGQAQCYKNLGTTLQSLSQYDKAREYLEKALAIDTGIGNRDGEATSYGNLGTLFHSLSQYDKAREYQEKALAFRIKIGDRDGEATSYGVYGESTAYPKIGDKRGEASNYGNPHVCFSRSASMQRLTII